MKEEKKQKEKVITNKEKKETKTQEKVELTKEEIVAMNKKVSDAEEKLLRAQADLINYRKRKDDETQRFLKYANEGLIVDLLPILDNFERAIKMDDVVLDDDASKFLSGIKMIYSSFKVTLEKYGVKEIDALGKQFDPKLHEAVMTESDSKKEKELVLEVLQKGYCLKDKVIRPAMVKVNK